MDKDFSLDLTDPAIIISDASSFHPKIIRIMVKDSFSEFVKAQYLNLQSLITHMAVVCKLHRFK